jgi:putative DNA primase/helicase
MRADKIENESVRWLWEDRIACGAVHILAGRPGGGKSLLGVKIAADVSKKGTVILSQTEEVARTMLGPRLTAIGANKKRIIFDLEPEFPDDIGKLRKLIEKYNVKLVICDPVNEHLSSGVSRYNDSIRRATRPLKKLAEETGCAIILVDHVLKNVAKSAHPLSAIGGASSGLSAAGRMVYIVGRDPTDKDRVIMCNVKTQLRDDPLPLEFELDVEDVANVDKPVPLLVRTGEIEEGFDPMVMLAKPGKGGKQGRPPSKREAALEFLVDYLSAAPKHERRAREIIEDAKQVGITKRTLEGAKSEGEIESVKRQNEWWWRLPAALIETLDAST